MYENISVGNKFLDNLYFELCKYPGWLDLAEGVSLRKLTGADINYLERLDDLMSDVNVCMAELRAESKSEIDFWIWDAEDDDEIISRLSQQIALAHKDYEEHARQDGPAEERIWRMMLWRTREAEALRKKIIARNYHKKFPEAMAATEEAICRAREYPLERLVDDIGKNHMARCRWHDDKSPSLYVKNGFGHCFSCGVHVDAIKWAMDVDKMTFLQAVERLKNA